MLYIKNDDFKAMIGRTMPKPRDMSKTKGNSFVGDAKHGAIDSVLLWLARVLNSNFDEKNEGDKKFAESTETG